MDTSPIVPTSSTTVPSFTPHIEPSLPIALSAADQATALGDLKAAVAKGTLTPEQAATAFDELGIPVDERTDRRSADVKLLDEHFPPAKPEEFLLPFDDQELPSEGKQSVRTGLESAEADRTSGNTFVKTVDEVGKQLAAMPEAQRLDYPAKQMALLKQTYGDTLDARFAQAKALIGVLEAKRPGLKALLQSGVGDSARVVSLIFDLSERWAMRRKG